MKTTMQQLDVSLMAHFVIREYGRRQDTLGELHGQTMQMALLGGEPQIVRDIETYAKDMHIGLDISRKR
jgi:hypothetical protein